MENKSIKLNVWDTAGQERYKSIARSYYKNWDGWLAVYDITDEDSFDKIEQLIEYYKTESEAHLPFNIVLIGNKWDLEESRVISFEKGKQLSEKYGIPFFETSVKTDIKIDDAFFTLTEHAISDNKTDISTSKSNSTRLQEKEAPKKKKKGCW